MKTENKKISGGRYEVTVEFDQTELQPYLEKAALALSQKQVIAGFRPGKAPFEVIVSQFGEMTIYEEAARLAVSKTCYAILDEQKLETVGQPEVHVEKLAPGNPFIYKIIVPVMPEVTLVDLGKKKFKKKQAKITKEKVKEVINNIRRTRATEKLENRAARKGDKVEVDFDIYLDRVLVEQGSQKNYPFILGEGAMLSGFEEQVEGMKAGEEKEFKLRFPKDYFSKDLRNRECDFKVKCRAVYSLALSPIDEDFLKEMRVKTEKELHDKIETNLLVEEQRKLDMQLENEVFNYLIESSQFGSIPDTLVQAEVKRMLDEFRDQLARQGINYDDYLAHINKKEEDLILDKTPDALRRVKSSLIVHKIIKDENLEIPSEDLKKEMDGILASPGLGEEQKKNIESKEYQSYVKNSMLSKKAVDFIKKKMIV